MINYNRIEYCLERISKEGITVEHLLKVFEREGNVPLRVSKVLKIPRPIVSCIVRHFGKTPRIGQPQIEYGSPELARSSKNFLPIWDTVYDLHMQGMTGGQILDITGISISTTHRILKRYGVVRGKGSNKFSYKLPKSEIIRLYQDGNPCKKIGEIYGVDSEVIRKRLMKYGIERRIGKATGTENPQWKGGHKQPMHYFRRQSYEVVAICLGQPLPQGYVIHHLDENPKNNHPENLILFDSPKAHSAFHQKALKTHVKVGTAEAIQLALENGGMPLPKPLNPIKFEPYIEVLRPYNKKE